MRVSDRGRSMLIELEEPRSLPYYDPVGLLTIGVGHLLTRAELTSGKLQIGDELVLYNAGLGLTDEQVGTLFQQDLDIYERAVNEAIEVELTQAQFDALVSFCFNVGIGKFVDTQWVGGFRGSTLVKRINAGRLGDVPFQLRRWKYAGGRIVRGLIARREVEIEMWSSESETEAA